MKRYFFRSGFWAALVIPLLMSSVSVAQARSCSSVGVAGKYGFTLNGVVLLPTGAVPIAAIGKATVDAKGDVSGTESRSVGGGYADETLQGTITVNPDCTGSMTVSFFEAGQLVRVSILSVVFDDNQREIRMVQKSLQLPDGSFLPVVITVEGKKIFAEDED